MDQPSPTAKPILSAPDLEIKDPKLIFNAVWDDLKERKGLDHLRFPREFIWLGGAPGAGKGTNTPFIAQALDITAPPIVVSNLLRSPQAEALKDAGKMVGDREVIGLLFKELLEPIYHDGVIVDGFPRTKVQVECLKMFYNQMLDLHNQYRGTPLARYFRKPMFRIALLFVSEEVSVQRQLKRGLESQQHNQRLRESGNEVPIELRATDLDPELCRKRYKAFKESTFDALQSLQKIFHFYFINAEGDLREVQENIQKEFTYQSSLELSHEVFDLIRDIPLASQLAVRARQELVERLEQYQEQHRELFQKVVKLIEEKLIPIVRVHATSGLVRINSEDEVFDEPAALRMMIDVFSERGFHATVDINRMDVPERINPETWEIICRTKKVYRLSIRYQPSDIRRGH
jgi:adenylate kinase